MALLAGGEGVEMGSEAARLRVHAGVGKRPSQPPRSTGEEQAYAEMISL
jgi:hypothetical protein